MTQGTGIDFLNWFTLLICIFLWLNRKKLTNIDVFKNPIADPASKIIFIFCTNVSNAGFCK